MQLTPEFFGKKGNIHHIILLRKKLQSNMASGNYVLIELKNRKANQHPYQVGKADCLKKKKVNCDELVPWRINGVTKRTTVTVLLFDGKYDLLTFYSVLFLARRGRMSSESYCHTPGVVVVVDNFRLKFLFFNLSQVKVSVY